MRGTTLSFRMNPADSAAIVPAPRTSTMPATMFGAWGSHLPSHYIDDKKDAEPSFDRKLRRSLRVAGTLALVFSVIVLGMLGYFLAQMSHSMSTIYHRLEQDDTGERMLNDTVAIMSSTSTTLENVEAMTDEGAVMAGETTPTYSILMNSTAQVIQQLESLLAQPTIQIGLVHGPKAVESAAAGLMTQLQQQQ